MFKKIIISFSILVLSFSVASQVYAYDEETTHPALTQEIVEFYNLLHPEDKITPEEKELIISGSTKEDEWPRWLNHFYDPVYKVGWTGDKTGYLPKDATKNLSYAVLSTLGSWSAVQWINDETAQIIYSNYGGNRTWKKGLEYFAKGDKREAYVTLGHALHLLEDMSVPDHSRNDTHAPFRFIGDRGSPLEDYLRKWTRGSIGQLNIVNDLKQKNAAPPNFSTIEEYLISLAEYSNKYFFSKDTVNDLKYQFPKIVKDVGDYGYGVDENGKEFPLALFDLKSDSNNLPIKIYALKNHQEYYPILDAYFSRLAPKAVLYGAGVIELFKKQAAEAAINREFPAQLVKYDFSFITPKTFSLAAEGKKIFMAAKTLLANVAGATQGAVTAVKDFFAPESGSTLLATSEPLRQAQGEPVVVETAKPLSPAAVIAPVAAANEQAQEIRGTPQLINEAPVNEAPVNQPPANSSPAITALAPSTNIPASPSVSISVYSSPAPSGGGSSGSQTAESETLSYTAATTTATSTESTATSTEETATSTATSTPATATSTATSTESTATSTVPLVLISEIQVAGIDAGDEFIELYNPATSSVDISNWSIQYVSGSAGVSTSTANKKNFIATSTIPAQGFFLIARNLNAHGINGYRGTIAADMGHRSFSLSGETAGAKIFLVSDQDKIEGVNDPDIVDWIAYSSSSVPATGQSLERKTLQNDSCISASGGGEFLGNGCDTGSDSDFEIRATANPQNSQSLPEPRIAPQVSNFNGSWSTSTEEVTLSWGESTDALGATSTVVYELEDGDSTIIFSGTSTYQFILEVEEIGLNYTFSLRAADRDGLAGETSSSTVTTVSTDPDDEEEETLAEQLNDESVAGPFPTGPAPGQVRFIFQFLGKGWLEGTTIAAFEVKYRAPGPWNMFIVGAPECSAFDPRDFNLDDMRNFTLETDFESGVLKTYRYTGSAPLNPEKCYAIMAMFGSYIDNNYIAGTASGGVIRPDYVTDRNSCNSKDGSGGKVSSCGYRSQGDYVTFAFFRVFSPP